MIDSAKDKMPANEAKMTHKMECQSEPREVNAIADTTDGEIITTVARIPRENGYGDFCLAGLTTWENLYMGYHSEYGSLLLSEEEILEGSNNLPMVELGSFVRAGTFPFFQLPLEIRQYVYLLLLGPFFDKEENIFVGVDGLDDGNPKHYDGDLDDFLFLRAQETAAQLSAELATVVEPAATIQVLSPEAREIESAEFSRRKIALQKFLTTHPERKELYYMLAYPHRGNFDTQAPTDFPMITLVRTISNVSNMLREEFGHIFWSNVRLQQQPGECRNLAMMSFIRERPVACSHVKSLRFWYFSAAYDGEDDESDSCRQLCAAIAKNCRLDSLEVYMTLNESTVKEFLKEDGEFATINTGLRSIEVTKSFKLNLYIEITNEYYNSDEYSEEEFKKQEAIWQSAVREFIMPNSLRNLNQKKEEDEYLQLRKQLVGSDMTDEGNKEGAIEKDGDLSESDGGTESESESDWSEGSGARDARNDPVVGENGGEEEAEDLDEDESRSGSEGNGARDSTVDVEYKSYEISDDEN